MQVDTLPINTNTNTIGVGLSRLEPWIRLPSDIGQSVNQSATSRRVESSQIQSSQLERSLVYYPIILTSATTVDMRLVTCESGGPCCPILVRHQSCCQTNAAMQSHMLVYHVYRPVPHCSIARTSALSLSRFISRSSPAHSDTPYSLRYPDRSP
jgi:hypothetical protein